MFARWPRARDHWKFHPMTHSFLGRRGIAVAPHSLASEAAIRVLREGGNALEAMIAAAATIAVVYPHMNSIGGDGFWVIGGPDGPLAGIDASGASAAAASLDSYAQRGVTGSIPFRGGVAALTVAGTISGWGAAHALAREWGGKLPLTRLLDDAIWYAREGIPVTHSQRAATAAKRDEIRAIPGFAETFLVNGEAPASFSRFRQPRLAATLARLAEHGTDDFYRGALAKQLAAELAAVGSPLTADDLAAHHAKRVDPLTLAIPGATLANMTPPSQGVVSLMILGIMQRLSGWDVDPLGAAFVHAQVEATKQAFKLRDQHVTDPAFMRIAPAELLRDSLLDELAANIDAKRAAPWGKRTDPGDTIWMGVIDGEGRAVSFIQSIYHEFGSGVVLSESGVNWQNRGCSFSLDPSHINALAPRKRPFHTLNPALARLADGRLIAYGTMGGDGQPQTQATVFNRIQRFGLEPQAAIEMPRWLLGRTWGMVSDSLKLEARFPSATVDALRAMGHEVELLADWDESVGHAGALIRHPDGLLMGGFDPRSNGAVAAF
jgi:gamma-glutamyltranspeptidase/glutathione hydrolase